jgi:hypothetical protein
VVLPYCGHIPFTSQDLNAHLLNESIRASQSERVRSSFKRRRRLKSRRRLKTERVCRVCSGKGRVTTRRYGSQAGRRDTFRMIIVKRFVEGRLVHRSESGGRDREARSRRCDRRRHTRVAVVRRRARHWSTYDDRCEQPMLVVNAYLLVDVRLWRQQQRATGGALTRHVQR